MYYYYDFRHSLLHFLPFTHLPQFYTASQKTFQTEISSTNDKVEHNSSEALEGQESPKIKQDQKMTIPKCNLDQKKKVEIISKKHKIKKIDFSDKRNIITNNINRILAFLQRKSKSQKLIGKIISKQKKQYQPYNAKIFYSYHTFVKNKLSVHVNSRALEVVITHLDYETDVFGVEEQLFYNKISRIAILYYLKNIAPLVTLQSQRLKNTCKEDHLKVQRYLLSLLQSLCCQQTPAEIKESEDI